MKIKKIAIVLSLTIFASTLSTINANEVKQVERINGRSRFATSVAISKKAYNKSDSVILANGNEFADALSGCQLALAYDAPILLTSSNRLDRDVKNEIVRLKAKNVIILGGKKSVSTNIEKELSPLKIERISGRTRYETSKKIMDKTNKKGNYKELVLVSGENYPDALSATSYLMKKNALMLLSKGKTLPKTNLDMIAIGGKYSLPFDGVRIKRISGLNRFKTSLEIVKNSFSNPNTAIITDGNGFADALSAVSLVKKYNAPILLSSKNSLDREIFDYLSNTNQIRIVGGQSSISTNVENMLKNGVYDEDLYVVSIE